MAKYYSGETCPKTANYGQYSDRTGDYAGSTHDKQVTKGSTFPPSLNNHNFQEK